MAGLKKLLLQVLTRLNTTLQMYMELNQLSVIICRIMNQQNLANGYMCPKKQVFVNDFHLQVQRQRSSLQLHMA